MKKVSIAIPFEEEKLNAVRFYAGKKDADLEKELQEQLQKLYEKFVPKDTREYIESRPASLSAKSGAKKPRPQPERGPGPAIGTGTG